MVSCFCARKGFWFETQSQLKSGNCCLARSRGAPAIYLQCENDKASGAVPSPIPFVRCCHSYMVGCCSESASVISLAAALLVYNLGSLDFGLESVPFIPVSLFCCLTFFFFFFLRSRREEGRWPDWGLMPLWIIHILQTTPVGSQETTWHNSGMVLHSLPANSSCYALWWKKN